MPESTSVGNERRPGSREGGSPTPGGRSKSIGWLLVFCAIAALVYIPAVLTGGRSAWGSPGSDHESSGSQSSDSGTVVAGEITDAGPFAIAVTRNFGMQTNFWEGETWNELAMSNSYAGTTAWDIENPTSMVATVLVGSNPGTGNLYEILAAEGIPVRTNSGDGSLRPNLTGVEQFTLVGHVHALDGACCAGPEGWVQDDILTTAISTPPANTREVEILTEPPNTVLFNDFGAGSHLSVFIGYVNGFQVASVYNTATNQVQLFTRDENGPWAPLTGVTCDSVFTNSHWWMEINPDGSKAFILCRNGGSVELTRIDTTTGNHNWTFPVDSVPPPTGFTYQQASWAGEVNLDGGGTGDAIAFASPGPGSVRIGLVAPVDGPGPPQDLQFVELSGAVFDRHAFDAESGANIKFHYPNPVGVGRLIAVVNCGSPTSPCTAQIMEDNSRTPIWSGFPPDTAVFSNNAIPIITDRTAVFGGTSSEVFVDLFDLPMSTQDHENNNLESWDNVVGGPP